MEKLATERESARVFFDDSKETLVAVVLPTYCEAQNIENLVHKLEKIKFNGSIIIIDDSSPDGTVEIVKKLQKEYDNIALLLRPKKLGLGTAIKHGFQYVLSLPEKPDYVITMDADLSHDPFEIPKLLGNIDGADVVVGSRYVDGGAVEGWPIHRRLLSKCANILSALFLGLKVKDATSGFRVYRSKKVETILNGVNTNGYSFQVETLYHAHESKLKVMETPICFQDREFGKSKLNRKEVLDFVKTLLHLKTRR